MLASPPPGTAGDVVVGGWAGFVFADNDKPNNRKYFDAHPWLFYIQAEPADGYRFFGEIEAEHAFRFAAGEEGRGEIKLERLYIERNFQPAHNLRLGKFFLPLGYWYRLHWHFLTETLSRPISFNNSYVPRFQVGLQYFGRAFAGGTSFDYYGWLTDGPDYFGTNDRSVDALGYGGCMLIEHAIAGRHDRLVGLTVGSHTQNAMNGTGEETQHNFVLGGKTVVSRLELRSEYYRHDRELQNDFSSWYAQGLVWVLPRAGLTYRLDRGEDWKRTKSAADHEAESHSVGILWKPQPQVLVKAEYRMNDFRDATVRDFDEWNGFVALKY